MYKLDFDSNARKPRHLAPLSISNDLKPLPREGNTTICPQLTASALSFPNYFSPLNDTSILFDKCISSQKRVNLPLNKSNDPGLNFQKFNENAENKKIKSISALNFNENLKGSLRPSQINSCRLQNLNPIGQSNNLVSQKKCEFLKPQIDNFSGQGVLNENHTHFFFSSSWGNSDLKIKKKADFSRSKCRENQNDFYNFGKNKKFSKDVQFSERSERNKYYPKTLDSFKISKIHNMKMNNLNGHGQEFPYEKTIDNFARNESQKSRPFFNEPLTKRCHREFVKSPILLQLSSKTSAGLSWPSPSLKRPKPQVHKHTFLDQNKKVVFPKHFRQSLCFNCKDLFFATQSNNVMVNENVMENEEDWNNWSVGVDVADLEVETGSANNFFIFKKPEENFVKNDEDSNKKFIYFNGAYNLLLKLLGDGSLEEKDTDLSDLEKELVREYLFKKKMFKRFDIKKFTYDKLEKLRSKEKRRRTEEHLKFVFKKCINHMQKIFKNEKKEEISRSPELKKLLKDSEKFDYYFYNHHFGEIAKKLNEPIEKFFHFRNWKNRTNTNIPKSITKSYIKRLKMNQKFMNTFIDYLENDLLNEIIEGNKIKIFKMVLEWETMYRKNRLSEDPFAVLKNFQSKNMNLPWGLIEVKKAIRNTKTYISLIHKN